MNDVFFESYRREFPITGKYLYFDHAGVAPVSLRVKDAVENFLTESAAEGAFYYPAWAQRINEVREACARLINAAHDEVAFVKSTSHGLSIVATGLDWKSGDNVLVYEKEFPSNLYPWLNLRKRGVEVRIIPSWNGKILFDDIVRLMDSRTRVLSVSSVQFSNGFRLDLQKLGALCRNRDVLFCVDAIQSLGVIPMDVKDCFVDFISADAHKWLLGPEGIGIFYCRKDLADRLNPPLIGWKSVQHEFDFDHPAFHLKTSALRFEEGSMNLMGIFALGAAIELLLEIGIEHIERRVLDLGETIIQATSVRNFSLLTPSDLRERGGSITFSGKFDPAKIRELMRDKGIMVNFRGGGIRMSPHFYNTRAEIEQVFATLDGLV